MTNGYVVLNGTVVFPETGPKPADILIRNGEIAAICEPGKCEATDAEVIDASGMHVFPGFVDAHVHFGYAEPLEEYATETAYAARGGVSTIIAYILFNESYREIYEDRRQECNKRAFIDFGFHFAITLPLISRVQ